MTLALFAVCTYLLPGAACAVVWHRCLGRRAEGRGLDTVIWLCGSTHILAGLYYVAMGVAPGQSSLWYRVVIPGLCIAVLVLLPRTTVTACRELLRALARLGARLRPRSFGEAVVMCVVYGALALLVVRVGSMTMSRPISNHDALLYATRGWEWHDSHTLAFWQPDQPSERGFFHPVAHSPSYELLMSWGADWASERFDDFARRSVALAGHVQVIVLLFVLGGSFGRWGALIAVGFYLTNPQIPLRVTWHLRETFRLSGFLLLFATCLRTWKLPLPFRGAAVGFGGAAALCPHIASALGVAVLGGAWSWVHRKRALVLAATVLTAAPIAVIVGGKQYVANQRDYGNPAGINQAFDSWRTNPARERRLDAFPGLPETGPHEIPRKLFALVDAGSGRREIAAPLALVAALAVIVAVPRKRWTRHRAFAVTGTVMVLHLLLVVGVFDFVGVPISRLLTMNTRYRLYMAVFDPLLLAAAWQLLRGRPRLRRGFAVLMACALAWGAQQVWRYSVFEFTPLQYPHLTHDPAADPASRLEAMAHTIGDAPVLLVGVEEPLYYTDVRGSTYFDPVLKPVYEATTPQEQHRVLWDMGYRYLMYPHQWGPPLLRWWWETLGYDDLIADERLLMPVADMRLEYGKTVVLYSIQPPLG